MAFDDKSLCTFDWDLKVLISHELHCWRRSSITVWHSKWCFSDKHCHSKLAMYDCCITTAQSVNIFNDACSLGAVTPFVCALMAQLPSADSELYCWLASFKIQQNIPKVEMVLHNGYGGGNDSSDGSKHQHYLYVFDTVYASKTTVPNFESLCFSTRRTKVFSVSLQ